MPNQYNERLYDWNEIKDEHQWSGILLGNGASIAIWDNFRYSSIFDRAASSDYVENPLGEREIDLFEEINTTNFEQILSSLATARVVNQALGVESPDIDVIYEGVQRALVEAVRSVHIAWGLVSNETLLRIREELLNYSFVYSTNYDLLVYWAIMATPSGEGFKDYLWDGVFDPGDTEIWEKSTKVLYIHGGLHLYRTEYGNTLKRRARNSENLLDLFGQPCRDGAVPLFVTEGDSRQKLNSIYRSDYLSFAYSKFSNHEGDLIIFGHSLGESDSHLFSLNDSWKGRRIAISLRPGRERTLRRKKANAKRIFPESYLVFFDSETHPLGLPDLKIHEPD